MQCLPLSMISQGTCSAFHQGINVVKFQRYALSDWGHSHPFLFAENGLYQRVWIEGYISCIIKWYESSPFLHECADCSHWYFKILNQLMYFKSEPNLVMMFSLLTTTRYLLLMCFVFEVMRADQWLTFHSFSSPCLSRRRFWPHKGFWSDDIFLVSLHLYKVSVIIFQYTFKYNSNISLFQKVR